MPRFKITNTYLIDTESIHEAIHIWRQSPLDVLTEVNVLEVDALEKPEPPKTMAQKVVATTAALVKDAAVQVGIAEKTRFCSDHRVEMQKRPSKFRAGQVYFACPERLADGSYCKAKPL